LEQSLMHALTPSASRLGQRHARGFTLIELMITVAIVAILTGIAYPSYRNYVIRSQIVNATTGLQTMQANMERYFQDNRTYMDANTFTSPCKTAVTIGNFTISCPTTGTNALTATTFQLQANGNTGTSMANFQYTLDQTGTQGSVVSSGAPSAWVLTCTATWELKAGTC
jgi:prepilin-type N-terminal cleavage/methylation domain-containing protein